MKASHVTTGHNIAHHSQVTFAPEYVQAITSSPYLSQHMKREQNGGQTTKKVSGGACSTLVDSGACIRRAAIGENRLSNCEVLKSGVPEEQSVASAKPSLMALDAKIPTDLRFSSLACGLRAALFNASLVVVKIDSWASPRCGAWKLKIDGRRRNDSPHLFGLKNKKHKKKIQK